MASRDGHHFINIIYRTAAAEVVHGACDTLKDRANGIGIAQSLNQLVGDVAHFQAWSHQHVCLACDVAAGSLLLTYRWNQCCICLKFTINLWTRPLREYMDKRSVEGGNITRTILCQLEDQIGAD